MGCLYRPGLASVGSISAMTASRSKSEDRLAALAYPRGRYPVERAAQLSGVPRSTLYDWRREGIYLPDFQNASPVAWSYRDLVFVRLLAWLRQARWPRPDAAAAVTDVRRRASAGEPLRYLHADSASLYVGNKPFGTEPNLLPFNDVMQLLATFDLAKPIHELRNGRTGRLWAPDLVEPSAHTTISPDVLAGEPCVVRTRIPTSTVSALAADRGLTAPDIVRLYPDLTLETAEDALLLERRLRGQDLPQPQAA